MFLETGLQVPFPVVVRVSTTLCAVVSALLGVYTGLVTNALGENAPLPAVLHCMPEATVKLPLRVAVPSAQMVWLTPALTVGAGVMSIVIFLASA